MTKTEKIEALKKTKEALDELMIFVARENTDFMVEITIIGETKKHLLTYGAQKLDKTQAITWKKHSEETA